MKRFPFSIPILLCLAGCGTIFSVGPDYSGPPAMNIPDKWQNQSPGEARVQDLNNWWTVLDDERLNNLIDEALKANNNLLIAESRVRQVKYDRKGAFANFFPQII